MKTGLLLQTCTAVEMARKMPGFARKYILLASTCPSKHLASIPAPHLRQLAILRGLQIVSKTSISTKELKQLIQTLLLCFFRQDLSSA